MKVSIISSSIQVNISWSRTVWSAAGVRWRCRPRYQWRPGAECVRQRPEFPWMPRTWEEGSSCPRHYYCRRARAPSSCLHLAGLCYNHAEAEDTHIHVFLNINMVKTKWLQIIDSGLTTYCNTRMKFENLLSSKKQSVIQHWTGVQLNTFIALGYFIRIKRKVLWQIRSTTKEQNWQM